MYMISYNICVITLDLASNILVHQRCQCESVMLCTHETNEAQYVLSDLDFLCFEKSYSVTRFEELKVSEYDPTGTVEMRAPEVHMIE